MDSVNFICYSTTFLLVLLQIILPTESLSIDQLISEAATSPEAFNYIQDDVGTVKVELDMLYTADQWREIQELNATSIEDIRTKRKAVRPLHYRWTQKTIPYSIHTSAFNSAERKIIYSALDEWMQYTCVQFRTATSSDKNKITFQSGGGCSSFVGMLGRGSQPVTLGYGCRHKGVIIHEVGHALGFHHEQTRPDRDNYVTIMSQNIPKGVLFNFQKYSTGVINTHSVPYDYKSIMHYGSTAFSTNGRRTIVTKEPRFQNVIGNRQGLSFRDIKLANIIYSCAESCPQKSCPGEGFVGKDCKCWCPGNPVKECSVVETTSRPATTGSITQRPITQPPSTRPPTTQRPTTQRPTTQRPTTRRPTTQRPTTRRPTTQRPTGNCIDTNTHCGSWASSGECKKNPAYMLNYCKRSCNRCGGGSATQRPTGNCIDMNTHCASWASSGECKKNPAYMLPYCRRSCNRCGGGGRAAVACVDNKTDCAYWAGIRECRKNPAYMLQQCKRSCGVCSTGRK